MPRGHEPRVSLFRVLVERTSLVDSQWLGGGTPSTVQVIGLAGLVGLAVLVGFRVALWTNAYPWLLSCCVGLIIGIMLGAIIFEFLPALRNTSTRVALKIVVGVVGFLLAWVIHAIVRSGLPDHHSFEEAPRSLFILDVVMDDVVEGLTLGFTSLLSVQLLLFSTVLFFSKNVLEGFTEASVLMERQQGEQDMGSRDGGSGGRGGRCRGSYLARAGRGKPYTPFCRCNRYAAVR